MTRFSQLFIRAALALAILAMVAVCQADSELVLFSGDLNKVDAASWGTGTAQLTAEETYLEREVLEVETKGFYEGARLQLKTPAAMSAYLTDPEKTFLVLIVKVHQEEVKAPEGRTGPDEWGPEGMPGGEGMPGAPGAEEPADSMQELTDKIEKHILDKVQKSLEEKMLGEEKEEESSDEDLATSTNENVNHQAAKVVALVSGSSALLRIARSDVELIDGLARLQRSHGIKVSRDIYRTALRVGSTDGYPSLEKYLAQCAAVLGHKPQTGESKTLVRLGRILSLRKKTRF